MDRKAEGAILEMDDDVGDGRAWVQVRAVGRMATSENALSLCCEMIMSLDAPFGSIHEIECAIAEKGVSVAVCTCVEVPYIVYAPRDPAR
jgi:hypothetical protein